eukprot:COSAG03_NODE_941_length_5251_cov_254.015334_3_plen_172_part_00
MYDVRLPFCFAHHVVGQLSQVFAASYDVVGCSIPAQCGTFVVVQARCTSGDYCPGGPNVRPGWTNPALCDGVPVYQSGGPNGPVLYRVYAQNNELTGWILGPSDRLNDCAMGPVDALIMQSHLCQGTLGYAPTAPVYSAGDGWYRGGADSGGGYEAITVTVGDGSATGGGH